MSPPAVTRDHVTFRVSHQWVGLPVNAVQEVLVAQRLAHVPLAPVAVAGFLNLRGQIVTAVDLRVALAGTPAGGAHAKPADEHFDVVVRDDGELFALLVDEVGDVLPFAADDVGTPPPGLRGPWRSACTGAVRRDRDVLLMLDLPRLLSACSAPATDASV